MKKHLPTIIAGIVVLAAVVLGVRSCKLSREYRELKLEYAGYKAIAEADHQIQMATIAKKTEEISGLTKEISRMTNEAATLHAENVRLSNRLDELIAAEPSQPELETQPLVINLRGQIKTLTEMFSLANKEIAVRDDIIRAWESKYNAQVDIAEAWNRQYESEHSLRLLAEGLVKNLEGRVRVGALRGRALTIVGAVVVGYVGYRLIK